MSSVAVPLQPSVSVSGQPSESRTRPLRVELSLRLRTRTAGPLLSEDVDPPLPTPLPPIAPEPVVVKVRSAPKLVPATLLATSR